MTEQEVLDKIDKWHQSDSDLPLHEYLGWTKEAYATWVKTGKHPSVKRHWIISTFGWSIVIFLIAELLFFGYYAIVN